MVYLAIFYLENLKMLILILDVHVEGVIHLFCMLTLADIQTEWITRSIYM